MKPRGLLVSDRGDFPPTGADKGEGNRYQHFHAKKRLPAGGGEPIRPAALHILLHAAGLQPSAAVPLIQPHHATGLVRHTQLHRPHTGKSQRWTICQTCRG